MNNQPLLPGDRVATTTPSRIKLVNEFGEYRHWNRASITSGFDQVARDFTLDVFTGWDGTQQRFPVQPLQNFQLFYDELPVATGAIDRVSDSLSVDGQQITVSGRSKTADFVDCSPLYTPGSWQGLSLQQQAEALAKPFGLGVATAGNVPTTPVTVDWLVGETPVDALRRVADPLSVMLSDTPTGELLLSTEPQAVEETLQWGLNMSACEVDIDLRNRFGQYQISSGNADPFGTASSNASAGSAPVFDGAMNPQARYRPKTITSGLAQPETGALSLAERERDIAIGQSINIQVEAKGWRHGGLNGTGPLWAAGQKVRAISPRQSSDAELLLVRVTLKFSLTRGTVAQLTLAPLQAWTRQAATDTGSQISPFLLGTEGGQ